MRVLLLWLLFVPGLALAQYTAPAAFTDLIAESQEAVGVLAGLLISVAAAALLMWWPLNYLKKVSKEAIR